jgi:methionyl-tRNA formyltransferase
MTDKSDSFVLLGTGSLFSSTVAASLLQNHFLPQAYIQAGDQPKATGSEFESIDILIQPARNGIQQLLQNHSVPFLYHGNIKMVEYLERLNIDFILVACWPEELGDKVLNAVNKAALNLHPSLLPDYRGRNPIDDQIADGNRNFGVSLHLLTDVLDGGDIVFQRKLKAPDSASRTEIEALCAKQGAGLFIRAMQEYHQPGWELISQHN